MFYDYTASYLAQHTNSIVVAPSLTSNIFATEGMWLGGDQIHRAAADLFNDDNNTALLESAQEAGSPSDRLILALLDSISTNGFITHGQDSQETGVLQEISA